MAERSTGTAALLWRQVRYENRVFWRTPIAAFFTIAFPLMFLFLFAALFGVDEQIDLGTRGTFTVTQFFAPALGVFAAASATYTNLGINTAIARDTGVLKRFLGTPLPRWILLGGKVGSAIWIAAVAVTIMMTVGAVVFDVPVSPGRLPAAILAFAVGAAAFSVLGLMVGALAPSGESAPAITNATILPMAFVSEVFILTSDPPRWLSVAGDILPLKHFVRAFQAAFGPGATDLGYRWGHLAVLLLWGVVGVAVAARFFTWDPKSRGSSTRRSRSRRPAD